MKKLLLNQKISKKLFIAFALVTLLGIINGLFGMYFIYSATNNEKDLYNKDTQAFIDISSAQNGFFDIEVILKKIVINPNMTKSSYFTTIDDNFESINNFLKNNEDAAVKEKDEQKLQYVQELKAACKDYQENVKSIVNTAKTMANSTSVLQMVETSDALCEKTDTAFKKLKDYNAELAQKKVYHDSLTEKIALGVMAAIIIVSAVFAQSLSRIISKMIGQPLMVCAKFMQQLAVGDVHIELSEEDKNLRFRKDEIGILADSFNKVILSTIKQGQEADSIAKGDLTTWVSIRSEKDIVGNGLKGISSGLRSLVKSITEATNQVNVHASAVSDSSMALSQGATEQASSIEELTASIEEVANQTETNTRNAQQANDLAKNVKKNAERGNVHMEELQNAMEDINTSSSSIKKIIKVIDDIAFQTNILALNAAVEAARAGQHGKGFAVVAEEVRTLAARSAQAAKETTDLIEGSIKKVQVGASITDGTTAAFKRMSDEVGKVADLLDSIAVAASEQSSAIEQINQGISQVSQVVQNNAAISQESAAASIELTAQAQKLKELLKIFKIKRDEVKTEIVKTEVISNTKTETKTEAQTKAEKPQVQTKIAEPIVREQKKTVQDKPESKPKILLSDNDFGKY